jgi:hypothetical protein
MKRTKHSQRSARSFADGFVIVVAAISGVSCHSVSPTHNPQNQTIHENASGSRLPIQEMHGDNVTLRQRLRFVHKDRSGSLHAVVEKTCDSLIVVGLGPFGNRLFSVRETDREISYEPKQRDAWPFAPELILQDIRRGYFFPLQSPPPSDGIHRSEVAGMSISEQWEKGRLFRREITGTTAGHPEHVVFVYPDGFGHEGTPGRIEVHDELRNYQLEVDTTSSTSSVCRE